MSEQNRLQISWVNSAGGALGAVSSAVVLSSLGAAGTLAGAALGSLCITVGGAVYSHYLAMTKDRVAAQALAARRGGRERQSVPAGGVAPREDPQPARETAPVDAPDDAGSVGRVLQGLPWKRIAAVSAALFAISMILIVAFELSTGRAVSSYTGGSSNSSVGTSIPGWSGTGQDSPDAEDDGTLPDENPEGDVPQEQEQAPQDGDVPQEEPPQEDAPTEEVPQEEAPLDPAPEAPAPQEEAPQEQAPQEQAPEVPAS